MTKKSSSVTIRDVACEAGVSVATVIRYIRQNARVSQEVTLRIDQMIADLEYVLNIAVRQRAARETKVVGILVRSFHNDFPSLIGGIEAVVQQHGFKF